MDIQKETEQYGRTLVENRFLLRQESNGEEIRCYCLQDVIFVA